MDDVLVQLPDDEVAAGEAFNPEKIRQFLLCFHAVDEPVLFRLIHESKTEPKRPPLQFYIRPDDIENWVTTLRHYNEQGYGIHFCPNSGGGKDEEIKKISANYFEADDLTIAEQWEQINAFPLPPSVVVQTRRSVHCYYLLGNSSVDSFRRIQKKLAVHFNADKNIVNESRLMRLPWTLHMKQEPLLVECKVLEPGHVYEQAQLEACLPEVNEENTVQSQRSEYRQGTKAELEVLCSKCKFIKYCEENANILPEPAWHAMITELVGYDGGREKIHTLSSKYPRYDLSETERKIDSFLKSGTAGMNCTKIGESIFACPDIGKCLCSSPAGLPYTMAKVELQLPEWYKLDTKTKALRFMPGILAQYLTTNRPAIYSSGMFYSYKDGYYKEISDISAQKIVQDHLIIDKSKMADISDATSQWRLMIEEDVNKINANRNLINLQNGLYNIKTRELMPHTPEALSTIRVNASYTPGAECPKFLEFLNSVLEPELIPVIKQMFGYCLTLRIDAEKTFMMRGIARSGKSTLIKIIENLVGQENCSNIPIQDLGERFKTSAIFGKLVNSYSDLPNKAILDSGVFKAICSGDLISGERKGKDIFNFRAFCKLIYSANELPFNAGDKTEGFFRRLIIIRFNKQIPEENVNPNLLEELLSEVDGILRWALEGLDVLITNRYRFPEPDAVKEEVSRYRYMSNNARAFVEDSCVVGLDYRVERQEFYDAYCKCCSSNGTHPMAMSKFTALIESDYHDRIVKSNDSVSRRGIWKGIKLNDETDTATRDVKEIYDNFLPF